MRSCIQMPMVNSTSYPSRTANSCGLKPSGSASRSATGLKASASSASTLSDLFMVSDVSDLFIVNDVSEVKQNQSKNKNDSSCYFPILFPVIWDILGV